MGGLVKPEEVCISSGSLALPMHSDLSLKFDYFHEVRDNHLLCLIYIYV